MTNLGKPITQRQLRVGEMIKQALGMVFIRDESKLPNLSTKEITVTEVRMSPDLKTAKIFVMPLGGKNADEIIEKLKEFSFVIRKVLSKKIVMKFLPKLYFVKDNSFVQLIKITLTSEISIYEGSMLRMDDVTLNGYVSVNNNATFLSYDSNITSMNDEPAM